MTFLQNHLTPTISDTLHIVTRHSLFFSEYTNELEKSELEIIFFFTRLTRHPVHARRRRSFPFSFSCFKGPPTTDI